VLASYI